MPYIGRNHIAGDHTSNFKVLDDISSYTATFNGSSALIVSTTDNTIRIPEHRFIQGQRVTYSNGGGGNIGGLTNGTAYFVTFDTANTFKLATSLANANNNTNINLSSVGTGSAHTLTAAFDGVNTTFKITHGGGSSADIVNSAQLQIAINNVIQKANLDSSYTEGFFVVDSRKIQFKTAPTANDIFWGNIIANTIETFDIADLKVDNFTGDGTTTQFTLSRSVPNNESVMVTIDGVLQHPSDKDTTRAYRVLSESVIEFSSPPPNHGNIQVRHLGFAGASTGEVSGFYGRTGNVVLGASDHITTGDITPRNINASGIVTASSFVGNLTGNVSGNLTVGGVLTYEDVTNVDSIGIITARSDVHVGAGLSVVGVSTFSDNLKIIDDKKIIVGNGLPGVNDLEIFHQSSNNYNYIKSPARGFIIQNSGNSATYIAANYFNLTNANFSQTYATANYYGINLRYNNDQKLRTASSGIQVIGVTTTTGLAVTGVSTFTGNIDANGDLDVDGHTNLDNVSIVGVTTIAGGGKLAIGNVVPSKMLELNSGGVVASMHESTGASYVEAQFKNSARHYIVGLRPDQSSAFCILDNTSGSGGVLLKASGHTVTLDHDLNVDGHTNLDNVSIAGVVTATSFSGDGSNLTGITQTTINNNADNRIITGSGTANTLNGESTLTYNGSGFLKVNSTDGGSYHTIRLNTTTNNQIKDVLHVHSSVDGATAAAGYGVRLNFSGEQSNGNEYTFGGIAGLFNSTGATYGDLAFYTNNNGTNGERLRITSSGQVRAGDESSSDRTSYRHQFSSTAGSGDVLSLQNPSNTDGQGIGLGFWARNTNNAAIEVAKIKGVADETQANSTQSGSLRFMTNLGASMGTRCSINTSGHFVPGADNTYDLGTSSLRWRDIYTGDLNLSNKGRTNDVDNSWGDWTLQEGESDVFMINNRSGKKFKIKMEEVN